MTTPDARPGLPMAGAAPTADPSSSQDDDASAADVRVYDPAMCCPTGVCGPSIDPALIRFASDLQWLAAQGHTVRRFNLSQEPQAFVAEPRVSAVLTEQGEAGLPVVFVGGEMMSSGRFPHRDELVAALAGEGVEAR